MELEKLHQLVHSLTKEQKTNFANFLRTKGETQFKNLYQRIAKAKKLDKQTEKIIRGSEFTSSSKYYTYRSTLAEWILQSLVRREHTSISQMPLVEVAYLFNAGEFGFKVLVNEIERAEENEDFVLLKYIYEFVADLKARFGIEIVIPDSKYDEKSLDHEIEVANTLKGVLNDIRNSFELPVPEKKKRARRISKKLHILPLSNTNRNRLLKSKIGVSLLLGDYKATFYMGEVLLKKMKSETPKYSVHLIARELQFMASNALYCGSRSISLKYALEMSILKPSNPYEEDSVKRSATMTWVDFAATYADSEIAARSLEEVLNNPLLFSPAMLKKLYFLLGIAFLKAGNFSNATKCIHKVWEVKDEEGNSNILNWEPHLAFAISHQSIGNTDIAEAHLRSAIRAASKHKLNYPRCAVSAIRKIFNTTNTKRAAFANESLEAINQMLADDKELRSSIYMDIRIWLEAIGSSTSPKEIVQKQNSAKSESLLGVGNG